MRVQSIAEANINQHYHQSIMNKAGYEISGKSASLMSFKDCLKSQIRDDSDPAMIRTAESEAIGSVWGYYMPQQVTLNPELRLRARAYESLSEY